MRRREFIVLIGSAAATWPLKGRAEQPALPLIGFLHQGSARSDDYLADAFRKGLNETGYFEGENVAIEYRWAEGKYDQLPSLAADLINRKVVVLAAAFGPAASAAEAATVTVPIVFLTGVDPIKSSLVSNLNKPSGNATGVAIMDALVVSKRLGLFHDLLPTVSTFAILLNPKNRFIASDSYLEDLRAAAREVGLNVVGIYASDERGIDSAFTTMLDQRIGALIVASDGFLNSRHDQIASLAQRHVIPTMFDRREAVVGGGLMSYGANTPDMYRQQGIYVGRILKGERPADLPVLQPTKFEFVLNLKTAKTLGLKIPSGVLAIVDEVIE